MEIIVIAGVAKNGVIGKGIELPWDLPEDLQHFKRETLNAAVIMGQITFDSLGKPLPKRLNLVLNNALPPGEQEGYHRFDNLPSALERAENDGYEKVFIMGGGSVYKYVLDNNFATKMILTEIKQEYEGDVYFPEFDRSAWKEVEREEHELFDFVTYERV